MKLNKLAIEEFKDYIVQSTNEDVYYQLKSWIADQLDDDQEYDQVIDFFLDNLDGGLQWID